MPELRSTSITNIAQKTAALTTAKTTTSDTLAEWKPLWLRMPPEKRKEWLDKGKVGVISKAYELYLELKEYFGEVDNGEL